MDTETYRVPPLLHAAMSLLIEARRLQHALSPVSIVWSVGSNMSRCADILMVVTYCDKQFIVFS